MLDSYTFVFCALQGTVDLTIQSYMLFQMIVTRAFVEARPLQIVSVGLTAASAFYVAKIGLREMKGKTGDVAS